jgi:hypothetical protein
MSEINNMPVQVTGYEERRHPAIRLLARACIEIARQRLVGQAADEPPSTEQPTGEGRPEREDKDA